jgi:uncharacterized SAM-binding protein YcdF (DUF218 family)
MLRRGLLALVLLAMALGAVSWFDRNALLYSAADAWIVSDPLAPADAAAVFGGGLEDRPFAAADYYRRGLVRKIAISNIGALPAEQLGALQSHVAANRNVLLKLGVPGDDIVIFGANLENTQQEVVALHLWAQQVGIHSIIVPTEIFGTRRLRWMLHHEFTDRPDVRVVALDTPDYRRDNWWKSDVGIISFQNEILKYIYYRIKY